VITATASYDESGKTPDEKIIDEFVTIVPFDDNSQKQLVLQLEQLHENQSKIDFLVNIASDIYNQREKNFGVELMRQIEQYVVLSMIDTLWMDHLDAIENLRQGIGLRGYGQRDPLVEYKNEAFKMFEQLVAGIDDEIVHRIYKIQVQTEKPTPQTHIHLHTNTPQSEVSKNVTKQEPAKAVNKKIGRNDPCWCGSGKKYKKCHLASDLKQKA
ncbi:MAG: SEC-C metal-binding domain-containing protein, partial [Candidatus Levyibacteriota bacterium]